MSRRKPGRERIDQALLSLLEESRLSETNIAALCREACVSRATFYAHYANVDEVYRELVRQLICETSTLRTRLKCDGCTSDNARTPRASIFGREEDMPVLRKRAAFSARSRA